MYTDPKFPKQPLVACPLCCSGPITVALTVNGAPIYQCSFCTGLFRPVWALDVNANTAVQHTAFGLDYVRSRRSIALWLRLEASRTLRRIRRYASAPARLLEFGCSTGELCVTATRAGYDAFGLEMSAAAADFARIAYQVRVVTASLEELPQAPLYDVVAGIHTLEHFPDPFGALIHIRRVLRPGGILYLEVPSARSWAVRLAGERSGIFTDEHLFFYTPQSLLGLLSRADFDVLEITTTEGYAGLFNFAVGHAGVWRVARVVAGAVRGQRRQRSPNTSARKAEGSGGVGAGAARAEHVIDAVRSILTASAFITGLALSPVRWCLAATGLGGNLVAVARRRKDPLNRS